MAIKTAVHKYRFIGLQSSLSKFCQDAQELECIHFGEQKKVLPHEEYDLVKQMYVKARQVLDKLFDKLKMAGVCCNAHNQSEALKNPMLFDDYVYALLSGYDLLVGHEKDLDVLRAQARIDEWLGGVDCMHMLEQANALLAAINVKARIIYIRDVDDINPIDVRGSSNLVSLGNHDEKAWFLEIGTRFIEAQKHVVEWEFVPDIRAQYDQVSKNIKEAVHRIGELLMHKNDLDALFYARLDEIGRKHVVNGSDLVLNDSVFHLIGWVCSDDVIRVSKVLADNKIAGFEIEVEEGEVVPIVMENDGLDKVGEEMLMLYDTPSMDDLDPSRWIIWGSEVFVGMIICDAGYGLCLWGMLWFFARYIGIFQAQLYGRYFNAGKLLALSAFLWGLSFNATFFGVEIGATYSWLPTPCNVLTNIKGQYLYERGVYAHDVTADRHDVMQLTVEQDVILKHRAEIADTIWMEIALILGIFHIITSLMRKASSNKINVLWMIGLCISYFFAAAFLKVTPLLEILFPALHISYETCLHLLYGILGCVALTSVFQQGIKGIFSVLDVLQFFSDVLSYLRLYALSLSGITIAHTLNVASLSFGIFAPIILVVGHAFNFILSITGGLIHGIRLNFIEWLHHSFDGGGWLFSPLKKTKK